MVREIDHSFGLTTVESDASRAKLLEFVELGGINVKTNYCMRHDNFVGASTNGIPIGHISWNFGEKILVISSIIAICKRGFSKQIATKSHLRASLKLDTLDALMCV